MVGIHSTTHAGSSNELAGIDTASDKIEPSTGKTVEATEHLFGSESETRGTEPDYAGYRQNRERDE